MTSRYGIRALLLIAISLIASCKLLAPRTESVSKKVGEEKGIHLAVFGDSLAAGLLANTRCGSALSGQERSEFFSKFMNVGWSVHEYEAIAKELEEDMVHTKMEVDVQKFRSVDADFARGDLSAFSGSQPYSFPERISKKLNTKVTVKSYAVSGARTDTLQMQIDTMQMGYRRQAFMGQKDPKADVIVVHVGGNDWCDLLPTEKFESNLRTRLENIIKLQVSFGNPAAKILVLPVSDLVAVMRVSDTLAFSDSLAGNRQCTQIRAMHKICEKRKIAMGAPESDLVEHRKSHAEYNQAVQKVAEDVTKQNIKGFTGTIVVGTEYGNPIKKGEPIEEFKSQWLAIDCFHPGPEGEPIIADLAWKGMERLLDSSDENKTR